MSETNRRIYPAVCIVTSSANRIVHASTVESCINEVLYNENSPTMNTFSGFPLPSQLFLVHSHDLQSSVVTSQHPFLFQRHAFCHRINIPVNVSRWRCAAIIRLYTTMLPVGLMNMRAMVELFKSSYHVFHITLNTKLWLIITSSAITNACGPHIRMAQE